MNSTIHNWSARKVSIWFFFTTTICVISFKAHCQDHFWERLGPDGGDIDVIATDTKGNLYVYCNYIYFSSDQGESWEKKEFNYDMSFGVLCIETDANDNVYVGAYDGLHKSHDFGDTWEFIDLEDAVDVVTVHAGAIFVGTETGMFRSYDGGKTWLGTSLLDGFHFKSIAVDPSNNSFYATTSSYIFKSTDLGINWEISLERGGKDIVFADNGTTLVSGSKGCFLTVNDGGNWDYIPYIPDNEDYSYWNGSLCSGNDGKLYGSSHDGIYLSEDNGAHWDSVTIHSLYYPELTLIFASDFLFEVSVVGVLRFDLEEETWELANKGIEETYVDDFAFRENSEVFVSSNGLFFSSDKGKDWDIYSYVPGGRQLVVDSLDRLCNMSHNLIYTHEEMDSTPVIINAPVLPKDVAVLDDSTFFVCGSTSVTGHPTGLYRSIDYGDSWDLLIETYIEHISINSQGKIFTSGNEILRSPDKGSSWDTIGIEGMYGSVTIDDDDSIFIVGSDKTFVSSDDGESWNEIQHESLSRGVRHLLATRNGTVFVGGGSSSTSSGVYLTNDWGYNWDLCNNGFPLNKNQEYCSINSFAEFNDTIYVATGRGVYKLHNEYYHPDTSTISSLENDFSVSTDVRAFPNPFNTSTTFEFSVNQESSVSLNIYNIAGQFIKTVVSEKSLSPGKYQRIWNGTNENNNRIPSGMYISILKLNGKSYGNKIIFTQ